MYIYTIMTSTESIEIILPNGPSAPISHKGGQQTRMLCATIYRLLFTKIARNSGVSLTFPIHLFNGIFKTFVKRVDKMGNSGTICIRCVKAKNCYFMMANGAVIPTNIGLSGSGLNSSSGKPSAIFKLMSEVLNRVGCTLSMKDSITGFVHKGSKKKMSTHTTLVINFDVEGITEIKDDEFDCHGSSLLNMIQARWLLSIPTSGNAVTFKNVLVQSIQPDGKGGKAEWAASIDWVAFILKHFIPGSTFQTIDVKKQGRRKLATVVIEFGLGKISIPEIIPKSILKEGSDNLWNGSEIKALELIGETLVPFLACQDSSKDIHVEMPDDEILETHHIGDSEIMFSRVKLTDGIVTILSSK